MQELPLRQEELLLLFLYLLLLFFFFLPLPFAVFAAFQWCLLYVEQLDSCGWPSIGAELLSIW